MKKNLIFLLLTLSFICSAQSFLKYITLNLPDVRQFSDSVALNAKEVFKYESEGVWEDNKLFYAIKYKNTNDVDFPILVFYRINYVGGTDDIVNPGTPQYSFYKITGKFIDLFPFWSKFMNSTAKADEILKKQKDEAIVKGATYDFNVEKNYWRIEKF